MSWASREEKNYTSVACANGEFDFKEKEVTSYMVTKGTNELLKSLIDKFLEEMDNEDLVDIVIEEGRSIDDNERRYGGRCSAPSFYVDIRVLNEDVEKINCDTPIRMKFLTNVYGARNQKSDFIKFFRDFSKILGW